MTTRNKSVQAAIPMIFIHGIPPGASLLVFPAPTILNWSHIHFRTTDFNLSGNGQRVIVSRGVATNGLYQISVSSGAAKATGNPTVYSLALYINGTICECSTAHGSIGGGLSEHSDAVLNTIVYLETGDYLEVYGWVDVGSGVIDNDSARFMITALPMKGWNNSRGGALRRKGDVDR